MGVGDGGRQRVETFEQLNQQTSQNENAKRIEYNHNEILVYTYIIQGDIVLSYQYFSDVNFSIEKDHTEFFSTFRLNEAKSEIIATFPSNNRVF